MNLLTKLRNKIYSKTTGLAVIQAIIILIPVIITLIIIVIPTIIMVINDIIGNTDTADVAIIIEEIGEDEVMASVKESVYTGWDYIKHALAYTVEGTISLSQTIIYGVASATTALLLGAITLHFITHPQDTLISVLQFTKKTFTTILTNLHVIQNENDLASPTVVILTIISVGIASIGAAIGFKIYEKYISHSGLIYTPESTGNNLGLLTNKHEFTELINNLEYLKYLLTAILLIQIISMVRNEINIYSENNQVNSEKDKDPK
jgi:hypothetical protein